ncbi:metallophosphoesterase family protein [Listeria costaricensis]|uniref:metallophosphoesterase family protein n=1 Tax=Listeria costaricensis TaxID=2026604 RepID=UPI000C069426|nr:metallophosphoesterase family protein [Listeria costaricensis]
MKPIFAVGDVHGELGLLIKLLENWQRDREKLVFVGDLIDRGENPGGVIRFVRELSQANDVVAVRGNHEAMLLDWLEEPARRMSYYSSQGGMETIQTLLGPDFKNAASPEELRDLILLKNQEEIDFIKQMPLYFEAEQYVFVHAGVDLTKEDWHDTDPHDFYWIREPFLFGKNRTGRVFIIGHTPVQNLHKDGSSHLWVAPDRTKLNIDGGAVFGGTLNAVVVEKEAITGSFSALK